MYIVHTGLSCIGTGSALLIELDQWSAIIYFLKVEVVGETDMIEGQKSERPCQEICENKWECG